MPADVDVRNAPAHTGTHLQIWDSRYGPSTQAFSVFRETICSAFMPWTPEFAGSDFEGRVESVAFEGGAVGRVRMSPIIAKKTKSNIANSPDECIHGNFILSGELLVEQAGRTNIAKPGDLTLYQSFSPVTLTEKPDSPCDNLAFIIPKSRFSGLRNAEDCFKNSLLTRGKLIGPLSSCLALIAERLCTAPVDELRGLFDACVALLPVSAEGDDGERRRSEIAKGSYMLREVLNFIDQNIADPDLCPRQAAEQVGISVRYVHKLFAHSGTTFSSYVTGERLEHIRWDIIASSERRPPISVLAYRWGFSDLSTFNRAFKSRFRRPPSHFCGRSQ